jgi:hypothetical protein
VARIILLGFKDNDAAEAFIRDMDRIQSLDPVSSSLMGELGVITASAGKVEALVARPTLTCKCSSTGMHQGKKTGAGFTKTAKFGWWVHAKCRRPTSYIVKNFITNMLNGHNDLLPELRESWQPKEENVDPDMATSENDQTPTQAPEETQTSQGETREVQV